MVGHDGHRGWVYYVAVDPDLQGKDFGRTIMAAAEDWLRAQGVEKVMLMVRAGQHQGARVLRQARLRDPGARGLCEMARWQADDPVGATVKTGSPVRRPLVLLLLGVLLWLRRNFVDSRLHAVGSSSAGESFAVRFTAVETGKNSSSASGAGIDQRRRHLGVDIRIEPEVERLRRHDHRHAVMDMRDRPRLAVVVTIAAVSISSPFGPIQLSHSPAKAIGCPDFSRTK